MELAGKTAFVTGGAGAIGAALARCLLGEGMRVVLADANEAALADAAQKLGEGDRLLALPLDVADPAAWTAAAEKAGPVALLCNNAGIGGAKKPLHEMTLAEWERRIAINLTGVFLGARTFVPGMIERGEGHVLNTASMAGLLAAAGLGDYTAAKFGVVALSETMRVELVPHGVGVSVLCPGLTGRGVGYTPADHAAAVAGGEMDPIWVARRAVEGIRRNELHILTHPEYRPLVEARSTALLAAFGAPAEPGRTHGDSKIAHMARNAYPPLP